MDIVSFILAFVLTLSISASVVVMALDYKEYKHANRAKESRNSDD